ncbi:enoyl-CoA hydratase-related protein [Tepidiforma flava]|uniref:Enoyl-CoA hydratase-related protein n=1 Tax=Tepidiforma flava TaxID=3004094 RepID=A0ABY7M491_9CHLR|nr:enoyl-CoA hydratase-related protein [Tepidiforma flava]WBL35375.1 enoyl-CoA hydratase-related protein [Tepidiforma flava]
MSMELKVTRYTAGDGVAVITLHRPERLNAWTGRMHTEYRWCLQQAEADPAVRVIVVTGAGRGFCAGADARALEGHIEKGGYDPGTPAELPTPGFGVRPEFDHDFAYHFGLAKPTIAAINGPAAGVGLVLACFCDIRFAAAGAKLTTAHGRLGLPAEYGLSWLLPRLIGLSAAMELLLSSRVFLAEEAEQLGLVHRVLPAGELMPAVLDYARRLARTVAPSSLRVTRRQVYADLHRDVGSSVEDAGRLLDELTRGPDFREGVAALLEKREPDFLAVTPPRTAPPAN